MATRKTKSKNSKKKNSSLFMAALIILAFLILLIIFLVKKDQIITNFKETGFFDRVFGSTPEFVQNHQTAEKPKAKDVIIEDDTITINLNSEKPKTEPVKPAEKTVEAEKVTVEPVKEPEKKSEPEKKETETVQKKTAAETAKPVETTDLQICFVVYDSEGSVLRKIVKRSVPKNASPLTTSINQLLMGPNKASSSEKNLKTFIPAGTKLIGARVKDGVAYLNFSEEFEINPDGLEGYQYQLMQVVYTATAFSTVNKVQFLIEGQERPYINEGVWIGSPLSRNNF